MRDGQRLGRRYGLLPSNTLTKVPSSVRIVPNKNSAENLKGSKSSSDNLKELSSLATLGPKKRRSAHNLLDHDLEAGGKHVSTDSLSAAKNGSNALSNPTFSLLDTIQELLQSALDANEPGDWERSVMRALGVCQGLRPYLEAMSSKVSPECQAIAAATHEADWRQLHRMGQTIHLYHAGMMTFQVQGTMLGFFASMLSARRILEIGTFTGFSTLCMAEATQGKVVAIEHDPYLISFASKHFERSQHGHKIDMICGDALEVLGSMSRAVDDEGRFDLIFIDGEKTQYAQYFKLINDRDLLAPGGLICIDETLWKGSVYSAGGDFGGGPVGETDQKVAEAMRELNRAIVGDPRLVSVLLPIRNGLTLVRRLDDQVSAEHDKFPASVMRPTSRAPSPPGQRSIQFRGVPQEGLSQQFSPLRSGSGRPKVVPVQQAVPAQKASQASTQEEIPSRQCSENSNLSDIELPPVTGVAERWQTC